MLAAGWLAGCLDGWLGGWLGWLAGLGWLDFYDFMVFRGLGVIKFQDLGKTWDHPKGQPAAPIETCAPFQLLAIIGSLTLAAGWLARWLAGHARRSGEVGGLISRELYELLENPKCISKILTSK